VIAQPAFSGHHKIAGPYTRHDRFLSRPDGTACMKYSGPVEGRGEFWIRSGEPATVQPPGEIIGKLTRSISCVTRIEAVCAGFMNHVTKIML
jgi:hypothetical protein